MNNRTLAAALCAASLVLGLTATAQADVVTLVNGDRISGTVTTISGGSVLVKTEFIGALQIPADQVGSITKDLPMQVKTADGTEIIGTLSMQGDQQVLETDLGAQPIAVTDLNEAVENYAGIGQGIEWISRIGVGYVLSTGNSETESSAINFESIASHDRLEHRAFVNWNQDEADGETTRNQLDSGYGLRRYYGDKWYALANVGLFQDELKGIDRRLTVGVGLGYQFFNTSLAAFATEVGLTQVFESLDGRDESNPAFRWGMNYNRWLQPERVEFFYGHEMLKIFDDGRGEVYKANTGIRFMLSDLWSAHARVDAIHETDPPAGAEKTDLIYNIGFGLTF